MKKRISSLLIILTILVSIPNIALAWGCGSWYVLSADSPICRSYECGSHLNPIDGKNSQRVYYARKCTRIDGSVYYEYKNVINWMSGCCWL